MNKSYIVRKKAVLEFKKKYAVKKAAEVIKVIEAAGEQSFKVDLKQLRQNVLQNLYIRHKDKEPN